MKAELLKKQEEYKLKKLEKSKTKEYEVVSSNVKKTQIWDKKKKEKQNQATTSIINKNQEPEITIEEDELLKKSKYLVREEIETLSIFFSFKGVF